MCKEHLAPCLAHEECSVAAVTSRLRLLLPAGSGSASERSQAGCLANVTRGLQAFQCCLVQWI